MTQTNFPTNFSRQNANTVDWDHNPARSVLEDAATTYDDPTVAYDEATVFYDGFDPTTTTPDGTTSANFSREAPSSADWGRVNV